MQSCTPHILNERPLYVCVQGRNKGERWALAAMVMGSVADLMKTLLLELHACLPARSELSLDKSDPTVRESSCKLRDAPALLAVCGTEIVLECAAVQLPAMQQVLNSLHIRIIP